VARASLLLGELRHAEAVADLLRPHSEQFAGHVSFLCEGSVAQLVGMLDHALGRTARAIANLEVGIRMNDRAGFAPRAVEARLQLAEILLASGDEEHRARARVLARRAATNAGRLGLQRLARSATSVLRTAGAT
jgi:hypothetical protein